MNFKIFLGAIMALFIGILIVVYVITKQANPVLLDEHGRPIESSEAHR
jgi:hypothetical protein